MNKMICKNCGTIINDESSRFCPNCGAPLEVQGQEPGYQNGGYQQPPVYQQPYYQQPAPEDRGGCLWGGLGFLIPLAGLILYLVWRTERPNTAKACGVGALVGVIIWVVFSVLWAVLSAVVFTTVPYYMAMGLAVGLF